MDEVSFRLLDLPIDLIQNVSNYLNIFDQLELLKTCKYLDKYVFVKYIIENNFYNKKKYFITQEIFEQHKYSKLLYLDLRYINFSIDDWSMFKTVKSLLLPDMRHGEYLAGISVADNLEDLVNLQELSLLHTSEQEVNVRNLFKLKVLDLYGCNFTCDDFIQSQNLEKVILYCRRRTDFDFSKFHKLKEIILIGCNYTEEDLQHLDLQDLEKINLNGKKIK